ncbi:MAG: hypothetical protein KGJ88_10640 [Verrucomicrobiota bacterium]|nr:hypothetical protein [Verrucomicrobiota bacterium]
MAWFSNGFSSTARSLNLACWSYGKRKIGGTGHLLSKLRLAAFLLCASVGGSDAENLAIAVQINEVLDWHWIERARRWNFQAVSQVEQF